MMRSLQQGALIGYTVGLITTWWIGVGAKLTPPMYPQPVRGQYYDPISCPPLKGSYPLIRDVDENKYFWSIFHHEN